MPKNKQILIIYLFLAATALLAYWQVGNNGFVNFDDDIYVTANRNVLNGLTSEGLRWAFTTGHAANWHPLTWMSHMLDIRIFGLNPRWHHLTNLLFHIANVLLLFFILHRMTKALWQSAFVAALFALHPLHVESVAWIAERKDVLSTFFWMLTLIAYVNYAAKPGLKSYLPVIAFFALGLLAKPMLVTLPFVLLLLDFWPLERFEREQPARTIQKETSTPLSASKKTGKPGKRARKTIVKMQEQANNKSLWLLTRPLLSEKIPLFALTALSCAATYIAQKTGGAVAPAGIYKLGIRIGNVFPSYLGYITNTIWPNKLAVLYPHPGPLPLWLILGTALLLAAVTFAVIRKAKRFPYLPVGWLWYTGSLVPVIGIVQVGMQAMADRYSYVPSIGLFIMAAWGIPELLKKWRYKKEALAASASLCLLCLFILTRIQVGYWYNSITLADHTLNVTEDNYPMYMNRGLANYNLGNYRQAIEDYGKALEIVPENAEVLNGRGFIYNAIGDYIHAIEDFNRAIQISPSSANAYDYRGSAYSAMGNYTRAIEDFSRAIEINPKHALAYTNRGFAYAALGSHARAIENFGRAIEINPHYAGAYYKRGFSYQILGRHRQAIEDYDRTIEIDPKNARAYFSRGVDYGEQGDRLRAVQDFDRAIQINPEFAEAYYYRGIIHALLGNEDQSLKDMKTAAGLGYEDAMKSLESQGGD